MKKKLLFLITLFITIISYSTDLEIKPLYTNAYELSKYIIDNRAYDKKEINEDISEKMFYRYFDILDPSKSFFSKSQIDSIKDYAKNYSKLSSDKFMELDFEIYSVYAKNYEYLYNFAIDLVKNNKIDTNSNEKYILDRENIDFPKNADELENLWKKRVTNDYIRLKLGGTKESEIKNILIKRYSSNIKNMKLITNDDIAQMAINSYVGEIDPHSEWLNPDNADELERDLSLSLVGMGAVIERRGDFNVIKEIIKGGPADKTGKFNIGDIFISVGEGEKGEMEDVRNIRLKDLTKKIRGEKGTTVRIGVASSESAPVRIITIKRDEINLESQRLKTRIIDINDKKVGYVTIPSFYSKFGTKDGKNLSEDMANSLNELNSKNVDSLVIDLRNNGGGSLTEAINMIGLFIGKNKVAVQVSDSYGNISKYRTKNNAMWDKPLVVMVNRYSASASEIFAGAMKDYKRGIIVGDKTWGKGTVQTVESLSNYLKNPEQYGNLGTIKNTIQMFFRPNGFSTQIKGITPDVSYKSFLPNNIGEREYKNALAWRKIPSANLDDFGATKNLSTILKNHNNRVINNQKWDIYMQEKEYRYKIYNPKSVSLNYYDRLSEYKEKESMQEYFKKEFTKLGIPTINIFEIDNGLSSNEEDLLESLKKKEEKENYIDLEAYEAMNISLDI